MPFANRSKIIKNLTHSPSQNTVSCWTKCRNSLFMTIPCFLIRRIFSLWSILHKRKLRPFTIKLYCLIRMIRCIPVATENMNLIRQSMTSSRTKPVWLRKFMSQQGKLTQVMNSKEATFSTGWKKKLQPKINSVHQETEKGFSRIFWKDSLKQ